MTITYLVLHMFMAVLVTMTHLQCHRSFVFRRSVLNMNYMITFVLRWSWSSIYLCLYLVTVYHILFRQVILVTDGSSGMGQGSLKHSLQTYSQDTGANAKFPLPFPFPAKLHILCISNPGDHDLKAALPLYQKLIDINNQVCDCVISHCISCRSSSAVHSLPVSLVICWFMYLLHFNQMQEIPRAACFFL